MEATRYTFKKAERLNSVVLIDNLFERGESMFVYPFKVVYMENPNHVFPPVQILVVVPKRVFKQAVDRNRVKRLIREAYRTNKHRLWEKRGQAAQQLLVGFVYVGKTILTQAEIEKKLILVLQRLK
ncbi:MAG: ribonuclease P protein component [Bacteroidales bacterium]|jgi:ribonuclease P protein component|nr:ribonuclease P protein component [Bacteroidales bacterium]